EGKTWMPGSSPGMTRLGSVPQDARPNERAAANGYRPPKIISKTYHVIPGRCEASNLRCAIAHRGISRFRVWSFGPSRNDRSGCLREQLVDILPVHQMLDERLQIVRTAVAIIDVVGVLPDVDTEDR